MGQAGQHHLVDAVGHDVGEHPDRQGGRQQRRAGERPGSPGGEHRRQHQRAQSGRQRQPGRAQPVVGQAFAQNHISGPARCCDGNEDQAGRVGLPLDAGQQHNAGRRQGDGGQVAAGAGGPQGNTDRAGELQRHRRPQRQVIDGQVERRVHDRRGDPEGEGGAQHRPGGHPGTYRAPPWPGEHQQGGAGTGEPKPGGAAGADLVEHADRQRGADIERDPTEDERSHRGVAEHVGGGAALGHRIILPAAPAWPPLARPPSGVWNRGEVWSEGVEVCR